MNAYELANHLDKANYVGAFKAATMLRQQAKRIEELEKLVDELYQYKESWENEKRFEQGYGHN
jgi:hypothetical protein